MRWTTLLDEPVELASVQDVFARGDAIIQSRPTADTLFETWERNHWDPYAISFEQDHDEWHALPQWFRSKLSDVIQTFVIGEHTGLDLLSPVLAGATTEVGLRFLGTQVADEARHSVFMFRLTNALWSSSDSESTMLSNAWDSLSPSYRELNRIESTLARATLTNATDYDAWLRQVTMFHMVTEGVLAYHGQRMLTSTLQKSGKLPGITRGFLAMGRDEARHVAFGLEMLREARREGRQDEILGVLDRILPYAITVDYYDAKMPARDWRTAAHTRQQLLAAAERRMRQIGINGRIAQSLADTANENADKVLTSFGFDLVETPQQASLRTRQ